MSKSKFEQQSFKDWMKETYEGHELRDIARYGAQGGYHGMGYFNETCALYEEYHDDIWTMINDDADSMGMTPLALIASFGGASDVCNNHTFKNLLVWYAAEKMAYELTEI
jgi:hypothetical protein